MGLHAALGWIRERGIDAIYAHEMALTEAFLAGLRPLADDGRLRVVGRPDLSERTNIVSVQLLHIILYYDAQAISIETRNGHGVRPVAYNRSAFLFVVCRECDCCRYAAVKNRFRNGSG